MAALLCLHVRVAAGFELLAVHVSSVALPAITLVDPFSEVLKGGTDKKQYLHVYLFVQIRLNC